MTGRVMVAVDTAKFPELQKQVGDHGVVTFLFDWPTRPRAFETQAVLDRTRKRLRELSFDPDADAVAMTGQLVYVAIMLSAVLSEHGRASLLIFDALQERYVRREVATQKSKK